MTVDPDILIVLATVVSVFALSSTVAGWASRVWPWTALVSLVIGLGILGYVHMSLPDGLGVWDIPNAFIRVAAMILN